MTNKLTITAKMTYVDKKFLLANIKRVKNAARLPPGITHDRKLIAAAHNLHAKCRFDLSQVAVEFSAKINQQPVVWIFE